MCLGTRSSVYAKIASGSDRWHKLRAMGGDFEWIIGDQEDATAAATSSCPRRKLERLNTLVEESVRCGENLLFYESNRILNLKHMLSC